jgi:hypothetical protein
LIILTATAVFFSACGGGGPDPAEDPKGALVSAFETLGKYKGVTMVISVSSDPESLTSADMTKEQAEILLASNLTISSKNTDDPEKGEFEMVVDIDGDLVEIKGIGRTFYARGDVRPLVERFGGSAADIEDMLRDAPPQYDFIGPAIEGEWIGLEGAQDFAEQLGVPASPDPEQQEKLAEGLRAAIDEHATVTSQGDDDIGHHVVASAPARPLFTAILESLPSSLPGAKLPDPSEIPDEEISLDVWIGDDTVEQLRFDLTQLSKFEGEDLPEGIEELTLIIDLEEFTDSVEAPEAAATVDFGELMQGFMGGLGSEDPGEQEAGEGPPPSLCDQLAGFPPDQLEQLPPEILQEVEQDCPELLPR